MAIVTSALAANPRYQWEANSGTPAYSQSNNCGPTCMTHIACFYRDTWYGIEATRKLVTGGGTPTTAIQQSQMLAKRGVPCQVVQIDSLAELDSLVGTGRRPIGIAMPMSLVPWSVRDHAFTGMHELVVRAKAVALDGTLGYWVNDPNFYPPGGYRPDPDRGRKFYSRAVMQSAFIAGSLSIAVAPNAAKVIPVTVSYLRIRAGSRLRTAASGTAPLYTTLASDVTAINKGSLQGGAYTYWNGSAWVSGTAWWRISYAGHTLYVILPFGTRISGSDVRSLARDEDDGLDVDVHELVKVAPRDLLDMPMHDEIPADVNDMIDPSDWQ